MKQPVILTNQVPGEHGGHQYNAAETKAQHAAGFKVVEVSIVDMLDFVGGKTVKDPNYADTYILPRHYANEDPMFARYIQKNGGLLLIPGYQLANSWYKVVPQDYKANYWLKREVAWVDTSILCEGSEALGSHNEWQHQISLAVDTMFRLAHRGKVFIKAPGKRSIGSMLYTYSKAIEAITMQLTFPVHGELDEIIYSEPMQIASANTEFGKAEYRCFIVNGQLSSASIYTDKPHHQNGDIADLHFFANEFAAHFLKRLPLAYVLDVARLADGSLAVVELNDIGGSGFYAQHDIKQVFKDIYKLQEQNYGSTN